MAGQIPTTPTTPRPPRGRLARMRVQIRRFLAYLGAFAALALFLAASTGITLAATPAASPPAAERVYDTANLFSTDVADNARSLIQQTEEVTGGEVLPVPPGRCRPWVCSGLHAATWRRPVPRNG